MKKLTGATFIVSLVALWGFIAPLETQAAVQGDVHNVMGYGAVNDTQKVSTGAIQAAIDSCYFQGGGTVYFPPGNYCTGTIVLKDQVTLYFESGATLYASREIEDYRMPLEDAIRPVLIYANGAKNITLAGGGTIHGRARRVYKDLKKTDKFIREITENAKAAGVEMKRYYIVPPDVGLVDFVDCQDVTVDQVSLIESTFWTLHMIRCERVFIRGIYLYSSLESGVNADGIDINSCKDVVISDCVVTTGDDAIVLKSYYEDIPCENITVTNCVLTSSSTALKLGTESHGDFRHILFNNCAVRNSNRGLSIVVRDGATVEDVIFSNITVECKRRHFNWWGNADAIWVFLTKRYAHSNVGYIKDVVFENITARGMGTSRIESTEGMRIENIQLRNVQLFMQQEDYADKRADHAFYAHDVKDLSMSNFSVHWDEQETELKWQSAAYMSNVRGLTIDGFKGRQGLIDTDFPVIDLVNVSDGLIKDCLPDKGASTLVRIGGETSQNMVLQDMDPFGHAKQLIEINKEVKDKSSIKQIEP